MIKISPISFISTLALILSAPSFAACPDFSGSYVAERDSSRPVRMSFSQTGCEEITTTIQGETISYVLDGTLREHRVPNLVNLLSARIDGETLVIESVIGTSDVQNLYLSVREMISKDAEGNLKISLLNFDKDGNLVGTGTITAFRE